ncbi:MAG: hypothetical protein V4613_02785 [Bacteroidota bacterium]
MNIEILTYLAENPIKYGVNDNYPIEGIPISEIEALEVKYNDGKQFPKALRELLFLAGDFCYVLEYGAYDTQDELQQSQRDWLVEFGRTFNRNFYVVDLISDYENFCFVYTDDGDNPMIYHFSYDNGEIYSLVSLKEYMNTKIDLVKQGFNPF